MIQHNIGQDQSEGEVAQGIVCVCEYVGICLSVHEIQVGSLGALGGGAASCHCLMLSQALLLRLESMPC